LPGQAVDVEVDELLLPGEIVGLQPDPDADTFTHALRIRLEGASVRPGQIARARLPLRVLSDVMAVPATAVLFDEGRAFVFRYGSGLLEKVAVQPGSRVGDLQVLLAGIDANDLVVMRDVAALSDGQLVEAIDMTDAAGRE
jgi:hypothetical protein